MSLKEKIILEIQNKGPMTVERYMELCLYDTHFGYYTSKISNIGKNGDFITSPEISQVFGELIGLWLAQVWIDHDLIMPFNLIELGPGKGTLLKDLIRTVKNVPKFLDFSCIMLLDKSEKLIKRQKLALKGISADWINDVNEIPDRPTYVIANEFFDALPIRQFIKIEGLWNERYVDLDRKKHFHFCHRPTQSQDALHALYPNLPNEVYIETNDPAIRVTSSLAKKISKNGGAFLIIDYGCFDGVGNTLQAVFKHSFSDPLNNPGASDLTTQVNFSNLSCAASNHGLRSSNLCTQRDFLIALGIEPRSIVLGSKMSSEKKDIHFRAIDRLINKDKMGETFKVMAFTVPNAPKLPFLETK